MMYVYMFFALIFVIAACYGSCATCNKASDANRCLSCASTSVLTIVPGPEGTCTGDNIIQTLDRLQI